MLALFWRGLGIMFSKPGGGCITWA